MQWLGITYLCWIGIKLLREPPAQDAAEEGARPGAGFYFRRGFAVALTNPKVIMFFMAFFPLFMRPGAGPLTLVSMMLHVTLICLLYEIGLVLIGNYIAKLLSNVQAARRIGNRLAGAALLGFGLKLALGDK